VSSIIRNSRTLSFALLASLSVALPVLSHAADKVDQSAWFEQQRQLTDGNANPFVSAATLERTRHATVAMNDTANDKKESDSREKSTSRE
jgi:hypothetical protein